MRGNLDDRDTLAHSWMKRLIGMADRCGSSGEVPVAAVILDEEWKCIGRGSNRREKLGDPLGHAELIAIRQAAWIKSNWRLNDCTLIVTLEPCVMCTAALIQSRISKVIFGAYDPKRGGLGGSIDLAKHKSAHHKVIFKGGVMEEETRLQLQNWFQERR